MALRYFNAAGVSAELASCCDPGKRLIPLAVQAALSGKPLTDFGTDYPTVDGTAVCDYVHVEDLASAYLLALECLMKDGASCTFNLGVGDGCSVHQVLDKILQVSGAALAARRAASRQSCRPCRRL